MQLIQKLKIIRPRFWFLLGSLGCVFLLSMGDIWSSISARGARHGDDKVKRDARHV